MSEPHVVYPGGPLCQPNCPGEWSMYHDGYADGYVDGEAASKGQNHIHLAEAGRYHNGMRTDCRDPWCVAEVAMSLTATLREGAPK